MTSCFVNLKRKQTRLRPAHLAVASLAALIAAGDHAGARSGWSERSVESVESRSAGDPIMAIVSLRNQRITVYDAKGWILHRWAIEDSFETAKNEFGLDHNESRSWHGWHRPMCPW